MGGSCVPASAHSRSGAQPAFRAMALQIASVSGTDPKTVVQCYRKGGNTNCRQEKLYSRQGNHAWT